jgi:CheY-like chemotaxis protein
MMATHEVLIVDDDPTSIETISACLEDEGYVPVPASTGEEALSIIAEGRTRLAIIDWKMPGMDGFERGRASRTSLMRGYV